MKLFTCRWLPTTCEPKALIFLCHGYAMECSVSMKGTARRLVKAGYAVYGMDYEGHGKSEGLQGFVPSFDAVLTDCSQHYSNICERQENVKRMRILLGESMGGAMALLLHRKMPHFWDGAVLVAPMCKIAEEMKPPAIVLSVLKKFSKIIPTWKIIPTQDIIDAAFRDPAIRKEVTLPFIVTHGEDDIVTDPSVSKLLHEKASSTDKTLKLYPGMWHSLTYGELPENSDAVFSDIIGWLDQRVSMGNSRLEKLQKNANDTLLFKPQNDSSLQ
nr:caffeoylshikimate esterase-like [Ipomoea batatas]